MVRKQTNILCKNFAKHARSSPASAHVCFLGFFVVVCLYVCLYVCLFVCFQDYVNTTGQIFMKKN